MISAKASGNALNPTVQYFVEHTTLSELPCYFLVGDYGHGDAFSEQDFKKTFGMCAMGANSDVRIQADSVVCVCVSVACRERQDRRED